MKWYKNGNNIKNLEWKFWIILLIETRKIILFLPIFVDIRCLYLLYKVKLKKKINILSTYKNGLSKINLISLKILNKIYQNNKKKKKTGEIN